MNEFTISRKDFISSWKKLLDKNIKFDKNDLIVNLKDYPKESLGCLNSSKYNSTPEEGDDYQYSYEEGYYKAIKLILSNNKFYDPDSLIFPIIYLSRHYVELVLKDSIMNLLIVTGKPFCFGGFKNTCKKLSNYKSYVDNHSKSKCKTKSFNFHNLKFLKSALKNILNSCNINIIPKMIWNAIDLIDRLSENGDEARYPTNTEGIYNFNVDNITIQKSKNDALCGTVNLLHLFYNVKYIYKYFNGLRYLLNDYDSILYYTPFYNPYIKELLYKFINSFKISKMNNDSYKQINHLNSFIKTYNDNLDLKLINNNVNKRERNRELMSPFDIVNEHNNIIDIFYNKSLLFTIFKKNNNWFLKTRKLIKG